MAILGTRDDWRRTKEKYGIPDAVCKFSLGEKIAAFAKVEATLAPGDFDGMVTALDKVIPDLKTYLTAIEKLKADKFKGKDASEKASNFTKAKVEVKRLHDIAVDVRAQRKMQAQPMVHLTKHYQQVFTAFKALPPDDRGAVERFYRQDMRNSLGLAVKAARDLPLGANVRKSLDDYEKFMGQAHDLAKNAAFDPKAMRLALAKALAVLHEHMN